MCEESYFYFKSFHTNRTNYVLVHAHIYCYVLLYDMNYYPFSFILVTRGRLLSSQKEKQQCARIPNNNFCHKSDILCITFSLLVCTRNTYVSLLLSFENVSFSFHLELVIHSPFKLTAFYKIFNRAKQYMCTYIFLFYTFTSNYHAL